MRSWRRRADRDRDTKVVDRGKGDGVYINTAGVGVVEHASASRRSLCDPETC